MALPSIRRNDTVFVLAGKDRGKTGRVLSVDARSGRAVVENINQIKRHTRPNPQKGIKGGIVERESSIDLSNLMIVCGECGKRTKVKHRMEGSVKLRVCKCGAELRSKIAD